MDQLTLIVDGRCSPIANMQIDLELLQKVESLKSAGILRIYNWQSPAITIGRNQKEFRPYDNTLDIPVILRPTGGGAVLHFDDITYALAVPTKGIFAQGLIETYSTISKVFAHALFKLGIDVRVEEGDARSSKICFSRKSPMDVLIKGKKLMGSAQLRTHDHLLQQGVIPISIDKTLTEKVFGPDALLLTTSIKEHVKTFKLEEFVQHLRESFSFLLDVRLF
jgi:lipoate-protein ligase A